MPGWRVRCRLVQKPGRKVLSHWLNLELVSALNALHEKDNSCNQPVEGLATEVANDGTAESTTVLNTGTPTVADGPAVVAVPHIETSVSNHDPRFRAAAVAHHECVVFEHGVAESTFEESM